MSQVVTIPVGTVTRGRARQQRQQVTPGPAPFTPLFRGPGPVVPPTPAVSPFSPFAAGPGPVMTMPPVQQQQPVAPLTQREVLSLPLSAGEQAVTDFIAAYPQCGTHEQIGRFIQLVKAGHWRGVDMTSVVRTLSLGGTIHGSVPSSAQSRIAGLEFQQQTAGRRGKRKNQPLPSLLWQVAVNNCGNLDDLNLGIERVLEGTYGLTVPDVPLQMPSSEPPSSVEVNQALTEFFTAHPTCSAKKGAIFQLLHLIDDHHLTGRDVFALFRTMGLEHHLPAVPSGSGYRVAGLSVNPATAPVRGHAVEKHIYKMSLLWMLLSEYCGQMDEIVAEMTNILSGHIDASRMGQPGPLSQVVETMSQLPPVQYPRRGRPRKQQTSARRASVSPPQQLLASPPAMVQTSFGTVPATMVPYVSQQPPQQQQFGRAGARPGAAFAPAGVFR